MHLQSLSPAPATRSIKADKSKIYGSTSFCFGLILNRSFPLNRKTSSRILLKSILFQLLLRKFTRSLFKHAESVYRVLLSVRMPKIKLYQISLPSAGRRRSGFEIRWELRNVMSRHCHCYRFYNHANFVSIQDW